ncbi:hypothetical protein J6590_008378 [Homalodisca vitripennis]|nr:hypothetical protein J6590_008378 [Homalodisca vitripennis]
MSPSVRSGSVPIGQPGCAITIRSTKVEKSVSGEQQSSFFWVPIKKRPDDYYGAPLTCGDAMFAPADIGKAVALQSIGLPRCRGLT